jgi:Gluconate 2-dehydrogenase subunit 3
VLFSDEQIRTLRAAMDRIVPSDDFPGAWEAGAGSYLLRQLEGDLRSQLPLYRDGLDALNAEAVGAFEMPFADLDTARQDLLLRRVDLGGAGLYSPTVLRPFFRALVNHTVEGYYSDPGNGGNHGAISWKMIGFEIHETDPCNP